MLFFKSISLCFLLGDSESQTQCVVLLDQLLDRRCSILEVCAQLLSFLGEVLDSLRDLDTVKGGRSELFVLHQEVLVDTFQLVYMGVELTDHLLGPAKLLFELGLLTLLNHSLPSRESSEDGG